MDHVFQDAEGSRPDGFMRIDYTPNPKGEVKTSRLLDFAEEGQKQAAAWQQGIEELGWSPGRNVEIEYRWPAGDASRAQALSCSSH